MHGQTARDVPSFFCRSASFKKVLKNFKSLQINESWNIYKFYKCTCTYQPAQHLSNSDFDQILLVKMSKNYFSEKYEDVINLYPHSLQFDSFLQKMTLLRRVQETIFSSFWPMGWLRRDRGVGGCCSRLSRLTLGSWINCFNKISKWKNIK